MLFVAYETGAFSTVSNLLKKRKASQLKVRRGPSFQLRRQPRSGKSPSEEYLARLHALPSSSSNLNFAKNIEAAKLAARKGKYGGALTFIGMAEDIIRREQPTKKK